MTHEARKMPMRVTKTTKKALLDSEEASSNLLQPSQEGRERIPPPPFSYHHVFSHGGTARNRPCVT